MKANMRLFDKQFVFFQKHHDLFACELIVLDRIPSFGIPRQNQLLLSIKIFGTFGCDAASPLLHTDITREHDALDILPRRIIKHPKAVAQDRHVTAANPNVLLKEERLRLAIKRHAFGCDIERLSGPLTIGFGHL
jgi:hypothetical protein